MTRILAINFILLIFTDILIFIEETRLALELASNFSAFFKNYLTLIYFWFEVNRHNLILCLSKML